MRCCRGEIRNTVCGRTNFVATMSGYCAFTTVLVKKTECILIYYVSVLFLDFADYLKVDIQLLNRAQTWFLFFLKGLRCFNTSTLLPEENDLFLLFSGLF